MFDRHENLKYDTHEHLNSKNNIINKRVYGSGHNHMGSGHEHMGSGHNHMGSGHEHFTNCNQSYGNVMGCGGKHDQNKHQVNSCNQSANGNVMNSCQQGFEEPEGYDAHPEKYREPL